MRGQYATGEYRTEHVVSVGDARSLPLPDDSVALAVTSPPYPMIEQWDGLFGEAAPDAAASLDVGDGRAAFERMHEVLDEAWAELQRVLIDGGIACVNVGDATRRVGERFALYPNHARVTEGFAELGFDQLPGVLWRKPTNRPAKFMGSGTLPPNAYVTLGHEHVLVFRNGSRRSVPTRENRRRNASYFYEERNEWFSDVWSVGGASQASSVTGRDRRAAFPVELPYRLICMFSVYGDRVLDPFWGGGTTTLAAMQAGRASVGVESDPATLAAFHDRVERVSRTSRERAHERLREHARYAASRDTDHEATHYDFGVVTGQERAIRLYRVADVDRVPGGYRAHHVAVEDDDGWRENA